MCGSGSNVLKVAYMASLCAKLAGTQPVLELNTYYSERELKARLEGIVERCPNLMTLHTLGYSEENRTIWALEISDK